MAVKRARTARNRQQSRGAAASGPQVNAPPSDAPPNDAEIVGLIQLAAGIAVKKGLVRNRSDATSVANEAAAVAVKHGDPSRPLKPYFLKIFMRALLSSPEVLRGFPRSVKRELWIVHQWHDCLMECLGRRPTYDEIAFASGLKVRRVRTLVEEWEPSTNIRSLDEVYSDQDSSGSGGIRQQLSSGDPSPEETAVDRDSVAQIIAAAKTLPERQRKVIECQLQGLTSDAEIAGALHTSQLNVRQARFLALRAIRKQLGEQGVAEPTPSAPRSATLLDGAHLKPARTRDASFTPVFPGRVLK